MFITADAGGRNARSSLTWKHELQKVANETHLVSLRPFPLGWLYSLVVFAAAWLVFWIQPLAVRGVLPALGGSPAVWNTAMVFFQSALLGGYALAHLLVRRASPAGQLAVLGVLWAGIALAAPIGGLRLLARLHACAVKAASF